MAIEIHPKECTCRGGLWTTLDPKAKCQGPEGRLLKSTVTLTDQEWKLLGRPRSVAECQLAALRVTASHR